MSEYAALYWAAACLVFWASGGATKGQMAQAIDMVCDDSRLTVPQEAILKDIVSKMQKQ